MSIFTAHWLQALLSKPVLVFKGGDESLDPLGPDEIAVELVELVEPELPPAEVARRRVTSNNYLREILWVHAHNLTVIVRGIWSDESITDAGKVDRMKWVNEILHRVTSKVRVLRLGEREWTEEDSWEGIKHWVGQNPAIEGGILAATEWGYDYASKEAARI